MLGYIFFNVTFYKSIGCWFWLWDVYSGLTKAVFMYPPYLRPSGQCFVFSFYSHFPFSLFLPQLWLVLILSPSIFFHIIYCCSNFCCFFISLMILSVFLFSWHLFACIQIWFLIFSLCFLLLVSFFSFFEYI